MEPSHPEHLSNATSMPYRGAMKRVSRPSLLQRVPHVSGLFAALFVGAYALLLVDLYAAGQLGRSWAVLLIGTLVVLLGTLGFPAIERRGSRPLIAAYFALQLPLGAAIFATSTLGSTFLLLVVVAQSVRVLPPWGTLLIGAPLPLLHVGMGWPDALRESSTFLVALVFLVALSRAMVKAERARAALDEANRKLRDYAVQSEELATARERNRIARDIHDGLGHYLTTIHMQIQAARSILASDPARADQTFVKAQQLAHEALGDVRRSVSALRLAPEERQPLPAALAELVDVARTAGQHITFAVTGVQRPLDPPEEQALYRAAQEGLTNACKYAGAASVVLTLDFGNPNRVLLTIADDGRGASTTEGGFGLVGLRERVQLIGGSITLQTAPGAGLVLTVEVPG
mgnify:CR=1 FL=1